MPSPVITAGNTKIEPTILSPTGVDLSQLDSDAVRATQRLIHRGFEAYLVGGCVRDLLVGRTPKDYDIATEARPQQVKRVFPRNCRIIGRRFKLAHLHFHGNTKILECSTFRRTPQTESSEDVLITRDNEFGTAEEDALRRDFTVNALFLDPTRDTILDYCNGLQDVRDRVIRTIGDPRVRFREDPVRILRAAKFAGRLGFSVEPDTLAAMAETSGDLVRSAPPRLLEEILRLLRGGHALDSFQLLRDVGAHKSLVPVLAEFLATAPHEERVDFWRLLEALDHRVQDGHVPQNGVLLGALLVCPVLAKAARNPGRSPSSIAEELLGPLSAALRLPKRDAGCLKRICGVQHRFLQNEEQKRFRTEGFLHGPYFLEALELFELRTIARGDDLAVVDRWYDLVREAFPDGAPGQADAESDAAAEPGEEGPAAIDADREVDAGSEREADGELGAGREIRGGRGRHADLESTADREPAREPEPTDHLGSNPWHASDEAPEAQEPGEPVPSYGDSADPREAPGARAEFEPGRRRRRRRRRRGGGGGNRDDRGDRYPDELPTRATAPESAAGERDEADGADLDAPPSVRTPHVHDDIVMPEGAEDDSDVDIHVDVRSDGDGDAEPRLRPRPARDGDRPEVVPAADPTLDTTDDGQGGSNQPGEPGRRRRRRRRRRGRGGDAFQGPFPASREPAPHGEAVDAQHPPHEVVTDDDFERDPGAPGVHGADPDAPELRRAAVPDAAGEPSSEPAGERDEPPFSPTGEPSSGDGDGRSGRRRRRRRRGRRGRNGDQGPHHANLPADGVEPSQHAPEGRPAPAHQAPGPLHDQPHSQRGAQSQQRGPGQQEQRGPRPRHPQQRQGSSHGHRQRQDDRRDRRHGRHGGPRDVDVVPASRDRRGKVEVIEPAALDLSAFDVELDPKRVPTFGSIVEGKGRPKKRGPRVPEDGVDDYRPPPPPGADSGPAAPPPPPPSDAPDTFGDW